MSTYNQVIHAVTDLNKLISDDSVINEEHVKFLLSKYRNYILYANFNTLKKVISRANYQQICIDLKPNTDDFCESVPMLMSTEPLPALMTIGSVTVEPPAGFMYSKFRFVNFEEFKYAGFNRFLRNEIYVTIGPDNYLYIKSNSNNIGFLGKVRMTALFDDAEQAAMMSCDDNCSIKKCSILEHEFPLEESYIPQLIQAVGQHLASAMLTPKDKTNDATDEQDDMANLIANYLNTAGKRLLRQQPQLNESE